MDLATDFALLLSLGGERPAIEPANQVDFNIGECHQNSSAEKGNGHGAPCLTTGHWVSLRGLSSRLKVMLSCC